MKKYLLGLLLVAVYVLHQDFWNWHKTDPLILGFVPVGLAYHAAYSCVASVLMWVFVKFAWPAHLEKVAPHPDPDQGERDR